MTHILLLTILLSLILYSAANFNVNMLPSSLSASLSSSTISPQLEQHKLISRYFEHISKKVVLDDGRVIKCKIPLLSTPEPSIQPVYETRNLTAEEAETLLVHLKDACTYHRTNDFLWEFCHEKYFRQYDDEATIFNAKKPKEELFFLGFHPAADAAKFERTIFEGMRDYRPPREYHGLPIRLEIPSYKYMHTFGRVARVMNVKSMMNYQDDTIYYVRTYVASSIVKEADVVDLAGNNLGHYINNNITNSITKVFGGKEYIQLERFIIKVVSPYIILLKDEFPMDIATSRVEVYSYKPKKGDKVKYIEPTEVMTPSKRKLFIYGDFIYGHNAFLSDALPYTSVLLSFDNEYFFTRIIAQVIDDYVIRLDQGVGAHVHKDLQKMIILGTVNKPEMKGVNWSLGKGRIFNMNSVILGKNTSFTKDFIRGDMVMLMEKNIDETWTVYTTEVLKVHNDFLMQVRYEYRHFFDTILSTSTYMVGKYADLEQEAMSKITHKIRYQDPGVSYLNTETPNSLLLVEYEQELAENEQLCNPSFAFPDPKSWLMTFEPTILGEDKTNLMLHISNTQCSTEGIEINFSDMKQVIIVNSKNKAKFLRSEILKTVNGPKRYHKETVWILFEKGILRVGLGHEVSLEKQLISLKISDYSGLAYYTFNRQFSYNVKVNDMQVVSLPDIAKETFTLMNSLPEKQLENLRYFDHFAGGTFCPPINGKRRTDIQYKCSETGKFLEIENIKEPSTCHYHITIGTRLLCPEEYPSTQDQGDLGMNINCFVPEKEEYN